MSTPKDEINQLIKLKKFLASDDKDEYKNKIIVSQMNLLLINLIRKYKQDYQLKLEHFIVNKLINHKCVFCLESIDKINIIVSNKWFRHKNCGCGASTSLSCLNCLQQYLQYDKPKNLRAKKIKHVICSQFLKVNEFKNKPYKIEFQIMKSFDKIIPLQINCMCGFSCDSRINFYDHSIMCSNYNMMSNRF
jgi:hypothetical protein